jgi:hypothetical protein
VDFQNVFIGGPFIYYTEANGVKWRTTNGFDRSRFDNESGEWKRDNVANGVEARVLKAKLRRLLELAAH